MPAVYVKGKDTPKRRFHRDPECSMLTKGPARGPGLPLEEVDLDGIRYQVPCRYCYPDAPRARSSHSMCPECNTDSARPCPHNGGIPVHRLSTYRRETLYRSVGETYSRTVYVWPEHLRHYTSN